MRIINTLKKRKLLGNERMDCIGIFCKKNDAYTYVCSGKLSEVKAIWKRKENRKKEKRKRGKKEERKKEARKGQIEERKAGSKEVYIYIYFRNWWNCTAK